MIIGVIIGCFLIAWQYRVSSGNVEYPIGAVKRYDEIVRNCTYLTFEHARKLESGVGGQIVIEFLNASDERKLKNDVTLNIFKPSFPKEIEVSNISLTKMPSEKAVGYVRVSRYWEQMSMNARALIALAGQAKIGNRKVLAPRVKDSKFGRNGQSLETYFNVTHFNNILTLAGYATLVGENDYNAECSLANVSHVAIYFLYEYNEKRTKKVLHFNTKQYDDISKLARKVGWTECPTLRRYIKASSPNTKFFCVNVYKVTEWSALENEVIKGAKCVTLLNWRGIGKSYRTQFTSKHLDVDETYIQNALKPSGDILKEADRFRLTLNGHYIAVHIRGEKILKAHNLPRLLDCIGLLAELVKVFKAVTDINNVLIASDTSSFGSYAWVGQKKHKTLKNLHSSFISSIGGIEYKPAAHFLDRGVVALVEMTLLVRAKHLITVGRGSFQQWIQAKFLEKHRHDDRSSWSLITMCSK